MYQGSYIPITSFKGGYCGNLSPAAIELNQALDLDNIVIGTNGASFRTRLGNSKINSTVFNSGGTWTGLGYFLTSAGVEYLVGVNGTKFGTNQATAGVYTTSFTDSTGAITITSGASNLWDFMTFDDAIVAFGGPPDNPDAPFTWTGSGNASALGGTPPSAYGGFTANNRVFAFRTAANPSTIYWSIIGNSADWSGSGSGSNVVGSLEDNQKITGAQILSTNYVLIFKEASTYQMVIASSPFPIYTLFDKIGCVGKHASINIDGTVYWINQHLRMCSTQGEEYKSYPTTADDLWNAVLTTRAADIQAVRQQGVDYDWIVWFVTNSGTTNNAAIIWDLQNQCWLRCSTGYKMNAAVNDKFGETYVGGYDGFVYKQDTAATYGDASESPATITALWRSGWLNGTDIEKIIQINELGVLYKTKASGSITINYGFDFVADSASTTLSQVAAGSETRAYKYARLSGRGNFFNFKISQSSSTIDTFVDQIYLRGKVYGQKVMTNP